MVPWEVIVIECQGQMNLTTCIAISAAYSAVLDTEMFHGMPPQVALLLNIWGDKRRDIVALASLYAL